MRVFALTSLSGSVVRSLDDPWTFKASVPKEVREDREAFKAWCAEATTKHAFLSLVEGRVPSVRVSESNPGALLHGLVADYDSRVTDDMLASMGERFQADLVPSHYCRTFSGGARLFWPFSQPLPIDHAPLTKVMLAKAAKALKPGKLLPGWDEGAFASETQYYEVGHSWKKLPGTPLSIDLVGTWAYEAGKSLRHFSKTGIIPLDVVRAELDRRFPGRWTGPFDEGARGVRFWDPTADNPTGAIVRESGMQCFTGMQAFLPWEQIFGAAFVRKYQTDHVGSVIAGIYYDGSAYWREHRPGEWVSVTKEDMRLYLRVKHGLSATTNRRENSSEVDQVLCAVQEQNRIVGALPYVHHPSGMLVVGGRRILNTATATCLAPANGSQLKWGEGFPWVGEFLKDFFDPPLQLPYFLSWLKHFYAHALVCKPRAGQAIFLAGAVNQGKTLLADVIISRMVGGHEDASSFLLGEDRFSAHALSVPLMTVNDTTPASDYYKSLRYSAMIKKLAANKHFTYEQKYEKAGQVTWLGRIIVTCNLDPESIRLLPNVEISMLDKVSLFRAKTTERTFPEDLIERIDSELPSFCRWLLEYKIPANIVGDVRYGVRAHHDPQLFRSALQAGTSYAFYELLLEFVSRYTRGSGKGVKEWRGTSTSLLTMMLADEELRPLAAKLTSERVGSLLGQLMSRGIPIVAERSKGTKVWVLALAALEQGVPPEMPE